VVVLGEQTYPVEQKRLREWLALDEIKSSLGQAVERSDREQIAQALCRYVSTALSLGPVDDLPWDQVAAAFAAVYAANQIDLSHLSFTRTPAKPGKPDPWEYDGRTWWMWVHDFARAFGWSIEYISDLKVPEAFALLQEVLVNRQLEREWEWDLSEYSLKYNKTTKQSEPNPLPRPDWMKMSTAPIEAPKPTQVPQHYVPVGNVIAWKDA
jgi:hypothetical protein